MALLFSVIINEKDKRVQTNLSLSVINGEEVTMRRSRKSPGDHFSVNLRQRTLCSPPWNFGPQWEPRTAAKLESNLNGDFMLAEVNIMQSTLAHRTKKTLSRRRIMGNVRHMRSVEGTLSTSLITIICTKNTHLT